MTLKNVALLNDLPYLNNLSIIQPFRQHFLYELEDLLKDHHNLWKKSPLVAHFEP